MQRDAALSRLVRTRRWLFVGAAALTAGFAAAVSAVAPGHTLGAKSGDGASRLAATPGSPTTASRQRGATRLPPLASPSQLGLQAPDTVPQSAPSPQAAPAPAPAAAAPAPAAAAPAPAPESGGGAVVSGGS